MSRLLWSRIAGNAGEPEEVAEAAEQMCTQLRLGLGRWIGATGYRALLDRALGLVRAEHPALDGLSCHGKEEPAVADAVRAHGAVEVAAGMMVVVAVLIDLLGRLIGEEMALRLVEQVGTEPGRDRPGSRDVVSTQSMGGSDARAG